MSEHIWVPSEFDQRRHCKHCGIYEDYQDKFPIYKREEKTDASIGSCCGKDGQVVNASGTACSTGNCSEERDMTIDERFVQLEARVAELERIYPVHPDKIREKAIKARIQMIEMAQARAKQIIPDGEERPDLQAAFAQADCSVQSSLQRLKQELQFLRTSGEKPDPLTSSGQDPS